MNKKLSQLTEKTGSLDQNDLMLISSSNVSKSVKVSTLEAPLKQYSRDKADEALASAQSEIDAEESRALAVEASLQSQISAEISSRQAAISSESSARLAALAAEQSSRAAAISTEQSSRASSVSSLQSQIDTEKTRAEAAESSLSSAISSESSSRQTAVSNLQNQINNIITNVDPSAIDSFAELIQEFQNADGDIYDAITNGFSSEASSRSAADASTLSSANSYSDTKFSQEASSRASAISSLQSYVDSEIVSASEDITSGYLSEISILSSSLSADILAEKTSRQTAISNISNDLVYEIGQVNSTHSSFVDQYSGQYTQLVTDVSAISGSVDILVENIVNLQTDSVSTILLEEEISSRTAADTSTLNSAKSYADSKAVLVLTSAEAYTDAALSNFSGGNSVNSATQSAIDSSSTGDRSYAKSYADSMDEYNLGVAKAYTDSSVSGLSAGSSAPTGSMLMYAGSTAPSGWLLCDGSAVSRTTYSALFAVTGTSYGVGNGSSTFTLPNPDGNANIKFIIKT